MNGDTALTTVTGPVTGPPKAPDRLRMTPGRWVALAIGVPVALVLILGNGLTGSTRVTFNGMAAAFTVESDTYIKARVPLGATSGTISVVTPAGTLKSNPQFVVTK